LKEEMKKETSEALKKLCQKAKVSTNLAITALPSFSVFSSTIYLSGILKKDLKEAINREAQKIIPLPLEEAILDWKILEKQSVFKKENYRILINVVAKKLVKNYMEIFKEANLKLLSLETESFALARSLVGRDPAITMIIDFSAVSTDVIIVEKMIPVFYRSISLGGINLTYNFSQTLDIDLRKAEQFKRDLAISDKIPSFIENFLKPITEEINYSIQFYKNQTGKEIEKIVISGGSAYLPKLDEYFSKSLNLKVIIGNPWERISYPSEIEPALLEIAPRFSVAIGSALRVF
ncbi:MAG: type IV pilus assembly protein PilM, partial [Patescibacteria group bacterium]